MHDTIQRALETLAIHNGAAWLLLTFCGGVLVYLLGLAWVGVALRRRHALSWRTVARVVALGVLAVVASKVLTHVVSDPRPYLVTHMRLLIPTSRDNGFPSDHTLLGAALTASLWLIDRRWLGAFALGTLLVLLGRLGVGAHHTLDVLGSLGIAAVATILVGVLPLPASWRAPLFPRRGGHKAGARGDSSGARAADGCPAPLPHGRMSGTMRRSTGTVTGRCPACRPRSGWAA